MDDVQGGKLRQQRISDEAGDQICHEIGGTAMTRVFDLALILENVIDRLDQCALAQDDFVEQVHQLVLHVLFDFGDKLKTVLPEFFEQRLGNVSLVAEQFSDQGPGHLGHGHPVIDVTRREFYGEQLTPIIDDQMQLEAVKPAGGGFSSLCDVTENTVRRNPMVVTDVDSGGINKSKPRRLSQICMEEGTECVQPGTDALDKAIVGRQSGKVAPMMRLKKFQIKMLERAEIRVMKIDQNSHDFTDAQARRSIALTCGIGQQQVIFRKVHKVIKLAEMFR